MSLFTKIVISFIAVTHCYFLWFEMFAWTSRGPEIFKSFPPELFEQSLVMASNQGLYNGFLAAGLIWSLFINNIEWQRKIATCFLLFVSIAGIYGAITIELKVLFVQAVPAMFGLMSLFLFKKNHFKTKNR